MTRRNFCFTLNNPTDDNIQHIRDVWTSTKCAYYIAHLETGDSGTPHLQGYVELAGNSRRIPGAVAYLGLRGIHLEPRMGSREQAITYCLKDVLEGQVPLLESDIAKRRSNDQGSRSDLHLFAAHLASGGGMAEGARSFPATFIRNYRGLEAYHALVNPPTARSAHTCKVLWGPTGTGKSKFCADNYPGAFWFPRPTTEAFFGGYAGESTTIIDDFYSWIRFDMLLRMLDRYPLTVNVLGGHTTYRATETIITSNEPPSMWYPTLNNRALRFPALLRRIDQVIHYNDNIFQVGETLF